MQGHVPVKICLQGVSWLLSLVQAEVATGIEKQRAKDCCIIEDHGESISFRQRLHT